MSREQGRQRPTPVRAALSRLAGRVAGSRASRCLIPWFTRHYGVDVASALEPSGGYASLQQFFTRPLKPGLRPIDRNAEVLVSPVDGTVGACGRIQRGQLLQAKGRFYRLDALLGDATEAPRFEGGWYATLYLAPRDYHRVHAPAAGTITRARHIPGSFYPVNPRAVATVSGLFARNERVVSYLESPQGVIAVILVGACLVGSIRMNQQPPYAVERGQEIGCFEFGSTVIVLTEAKIAVSPIIQPGDQVPMGRSLLRSRTTDHGPQATSTPAPAASPENPPPAAY